MMVVGLGLLLPTSLSRRNARALIHHLRVTTVREVSPKEKRTYKTSLTNKTMKFTKKAIKTTLKTF